MIYVKGFERESVAWDQVPEMLIWAYGQDGMTYTTVYFIATDTTDAA